MAGTTGPATVASIAIFLILRVFHKVLEYQFIPLAGNGTNTSDVHPKELPTSDSGGKYDGTVSSITSWVYTCRYLLPVLGGLLACRLGHVRTLQIGGVAMLASAGVASVAIYRLEWRAGSDSVSALAACLLMLLGNGFVMPSVMHGILVKRSRLRHRTVLCALIYMSSSAGLAVGVQFAKLHDLLSGHYAITCLALAGIFCAVAVLLLPRLDAAAAVLETVVQVAGDEARDGGRIHLPGNYRLQCCFVVFTAVLPFLVGLCDDRANVLKAGLKFSQNASVHGGGRGGADARETLTATLLAAGLVGTNAALMAVACLRRRHRLPVKPRLVAGVCLEAALELGLAVVTGVPGLAASPAVVGAVNTVASLVDAVAAVLVMVAAYELMDGFERDAARPLIVGVSLTVWGLATVFSRVLVEICEFLPPNNPVLLPRQGKTSLLFVYHVIQLLLLSGNLVYFRFCAFNAAEKVTVFYEDAADEQRNVQHQGDGAGLLNDDEAQPLIS